MFRDTFSPPLHPRPGLPRQNPFLRPHKPQMVKKSTRAAIACNRCRTLKQRCIEGNPCFGCKLHGRDCEYPEPRRNVGNLRRTVTEQQRTINTAVTEISALTVRLDTILAARPSVEIYRNWNGRAWPLDDPSRGKWRVQELVGGYIKDFYSMHPILSPREIKRLVNEHLTGCAKSSIDTALVFLMMALGEVCESASPDRLFPPSTPSSSDPGVIPGWQYFQDAAAVLDGNSIQHIQRDILAALYLAQLRQLQQSFDYLHKASIGIEMYLQVELEQPAPLTLAFWACLQLQSEFPSDSPSPLSPYEANMPLPNLQESGNGPIFDRYIKHVSWRIMIQADGDLPEYEQLVNVTDSLNRFLDHLGTTPHVSMPLARLWARCYDTAAEMYRPFLRRILKNPESFSDAVIQRIFTNGVLALIRSITAFDNIGHLVVSNVCMTAYVKSVNMIVLLKIYQNQTSCLLLGFSISRDDLRTLLQNTLSFIAQADSHVAAPAFKALREAAQKTDLLDNTPADISGPSD